MIKIIITLILLNLSVYGCGVYTTPVPIADISVEIDAKKDKTSFVITWNFKEDLLCEHDKNQNNKFDKNEQDEIIQEYIHHLEKTNYITEIVYVKKAQRIKKSLIQKIDVKDSKMTFSGMKVKYVYKFEMPFVLQKDHRMFIRFLDPSEKVEVTLKDIKLKNYHTKSVIVIQDIRANIYFYNHVKKYNKLKDALLQK